MKIVAILQNQWFKNPERVKRMFDFHGEERRNLVIKRLLFFSSLTGRRIKAVFGDDLCESIVWEEASREFGGKSDSVFPADIEHLRSFIRQQNPGIVLTFGKVATEGIRDAFPNANCFMVISGPHPAARHSAVNEQLKEMATTLTRYLYLAVQS